MPAKTLSPSAILLTRMTMHIPADTPIRVSVLKFPYRRAVTEFLATFEAIYKHQHGKLPYRHALPSRQLNSALMALAPSVIHGFEAKKDNDCVNGQLAVFTRYVNGEIDNVPTHDHLQGLIKTWLEVWARSDPKITAIVAGDGKSAWDALIAAVLGEPECDWEPPVSPSDYLTDLKRDDALAYAVLPALLTRLLHGQSMTIVSPEGTEVAITWRRAHSGGKKGVHLVSQPIATRDSYFAYRLDFGVQTQTGRSDERGHLLPWIFAHLSIQRYVSAPLRKWNPRRDVSILVGNNCEQLGAWEQDTTLISLPITYKQGAWAWADGVGRLLDAYARRRLIVPQQVLDNPLAYGGFDPAQPSSTDEYRIIFAEGYKFGGDKRGHGHPVPTGTSLRERSSLLHGVLTLLDGWLHTDTPLPIDDHVSGKTYARYHYDQMAQTDTTRKKQAAWRDALTRSLRHTGHSHLQIAVLYRSEAHFLPHVLPMLHKVLLGIDADDPPLVTITPIPVSPLLLAPLDDGGLDPQWAWSSNADERKQWVDQMRAAYTTKREAWQAFLRQIAWLPNARRLALIESTGTQGQPDHAPEPDLEGTPIAPTPTIPAAKLSPSQTIKGAVRDACNREGIGSQFLIGSFRLGGPRKQPHELAGESAGRIKSAVLDLILRQQAILYAPPSEIYAHTAGLEPEVAQQLDVIALCRVQKDLDDAPGYFQYALAVRLRADGAVQVLLPDCADWQSYEEAAYRVGKQFSEARAGLASRQLPAALKMSKADLRVFAERVLTQPFARPTLAVIEAERWRDGAWDPNAAGWSQLRNEDLSKMLTELRFTPHTVYRREAERLAHLLAVVRVRMNAETPQYVTAADFAAEDEMRDIPHLTGYFETAPGQLFHYFSVPGLPETQRKAGQDAPDNRESFKTDLKDDDDDIAYKHAQLVELVPFFVHPAYQTAVRRAQLCRCLHYLRISPSFVMGNILLPYPMHLGEALIEDQLSLLDPEI